MYTLDFKKEQCKKANLSNLMTRKKDKEDKVETDFLPHWEAVSWSYPSKGLFFMFQTIKQFSKC